MRSALAAALALGLSGGCVPPPPGGPPPSDCPRPEVVDSRPSSGFAQPGPNRLRVHAVQFHHAFEQVESYGTFRRAIECAFERYVRPHLARGRPNLVVFDEDVALMALATGTRGAAARAFADSPEGHGPDGGLPIGALTGMSMLFEPYAGPIAYYQQRFGAIDLRKVLFVAATDTLVRAFEETFSGLARRHHVYVAAANNEPEWQESTNPADVAALADPDLAADYAAGQRRSVYVATSTSVRNTAFLWGPRDLRHDGPRSRRNLLGLNHKVPLTSLESDLLALDEGPATGPEAIDNLRPVSIPGSGARIGFATSLPAFVYGEESAEPCADVSLTYMRCLDVLGANVVLQMDANPGRWANTATPATPSAWEPYGWMSSTARAVTDPSVRFRYNVCAFLTGNLFDIVFDGQSSITARVETAPPRAYVGNHTFPPPYGGPSERFLALAPWVAEDGPIADLAATGTRLAPGSGDALENRYVETAIFADLVFPAGS